MTEFIIKIPANKKGKVLLEFLKQIDYIKIDEASASTIFQMGIAQSFSDLKEGRVSNWKTKTISLKNA